MTVSIDYCANLVYHDGVLVYLLTPGGQFASPYLGMGNSPVAAVDPDGRFVDWIRGIQSRGLALYAYANFPVIYRLHLIIDDNKGIISISFNHLNLPEEIVFSQIKKIRFFIKPGN